MSGDALYRVLARVLDATVWGGELIGAEFLKAEGPAVFVANHAAAVGPIAVTSSLPVRLHPWVVNDMLDWGKAAAYLRKDFVEPQLHVPDRLALPLSTLISHASVRLLRAVECIPVWNGEEMLETFRLSVQRLAKGGSLLIFPEDPMFPIDERCGMRPFKTGFARLGEMHFARTQTSLPFYPVAVRVAAREIQIAQPVMFNPLNKPRMERARIARLLESIIRRMVAGNAPETFASVAFPR